MFPARLCFVALLLALAPLCATAQYVADTGRTDKPTINWSQGSVTTAPAAASPAPSSADPATSPNAELRPSEFMIPAVDAALTNANLDRVALQSEGVVRTMNTFAEIMVHAITGKKTYEGKPPLVTALSMIYQNPQWMRVAMLPVGTPRLAQLFGLDPTKHNRVSAAWILRSPEARPLVVGVLSGEDANKLVPGDPDTAKALKKFAYRWAAFMNLPDEFKLLPVPNAIGAWVSPFALLDPSSIPDDRLSAEVARIDRAADPSALAVIRLNAALARAYQQAQPDDIAPAVDNLLATMDANPLYMSSARRAIDRWNTAVHPFQVSAWIYIAAFVAFCGYLFTTRRPQEEDETVWVDQPSPAASQPDAPEVHLSTEVHDSVRSADGAAHEVVIRRSELDGDADVSLAHAVARRGNPVAWGFSFMLMALATAMLLTALVVRYILAERMPVSNLYESITFSLGAFGVVALVFEGIYRRGWVGAGACAAGWGLMTMANSLPLHMRKVEPLVAVLDSFWLNYHVTSLLISYSAFLLGFVFCVLYFIKDMTGNRPGMLPRREVFEYLNYRAVQVGWPLLTLGIFLGAVWANTAWGNAWSWDPKETWALITWFIYTIFLHVRMNLGWTGRKSILTSMVGFAVMLVTYFGVNYLPYIGGGMHSYAEPIAR
ncbi:c-type cytochrome biogenesis protein CcsB [candidate division BRC1 bacterium HGW-BRC1-1]|jgi:cytochrome c-type biogenesis protein CcsB|nr:MAG: c-type cytochrome biogenesis protein CcsB [candidate division BRC1 bacterium HGW-BRC1-1]